jgi:hypothetical protein
MKIAIKCRNISKYIDLLHTQSISYVSFMRKQISCNCNFERVSVIQNHKHHLYIYQKILKHLPNNFESYYRISASTVYNSIIYNL